MSVLTHYFALTLRIFVRAPLATGVNVLTLSAGLFCFLTAYAFVKFWNGAERHFPNADRVHVLTTTFRFPGLESRADTTGPTRAAAQLRIDFPELERVARATPIDDWTIVSADGNAIRSHAVAVDPEFLAIFALPFLSGDPLRALDTPRSAVLTRDTARRLFGAGDPVGRSVLIDNRVDVAVAGMIDAVAEPSHFGRSTSASLPFELLVSHDVYDALAGGSNADEPDGLTLASMTYLLLPEDRSLTAAGVEARLDGFAERHIDAPTLAQAGAEIEFGVVPVTHLLRKAIDESLFPEGATISVSVVLLALGGLVLAVACVNYATLATAAAVRRVRESGVRKTLGASPSQVMTQHLLEAALLSVSALLAATGVFRAAAPLLRPLIGADPWEALLAGPSAWMFLVLVVAGVTLAAGAYPAFVVSRALPLDALRASRLRVGPKRLTVSLVGAQFTVASLLLIGVTLTWLQNSELARTGLGTSSDPLVVIENRNGSNRVDQETLRAELTRIQQVRGVTDTGSEPWLDLGAITLSATPNGTTPVMTFRQDVGRDFFSVFDVELLAGRALSPDRAEDQPSFSVDRPYNVVVDRIFVDQFGFASSEDAIGQLVYFPAPDGRALPNRIVGVAETVRWNFASIGGATATIYRLSPGNEFTVVKVARDDIAGALQRIDEVWSNLAPNVPVERRFLDDVFQEAYETFARINQVVTFLALVAFAIATTGLIGMATLATSRRVREIAVRKVHGARTWQMMFMLLASFTKPVVVATLLAWPIAYVAGRAYLDMFAYSIPLTPLPFLLCLAVTLAIACMAVAGQTLRAARTRPGEMLRTD